MSPLRRTRDGFNPDDPNRVPSRIASEVRAERLDEMEIARARRQLRLARAVAVLFTAAVTVSVAAVIYSRVGVS